MCSGNPAPKTVVAEEEGDILECHSSSCLPRNHCQVSNAWYSNSSRPNHDLLCAVMEICMKSKCEGERFVQCVQAAPEPLRVLASEQQLLDIEHFCTYEDEFTVLGFDPTFNCGKFMVMVTAYKNCMLKNFYGNLKYRILLDFFHCWSTSTPFSHTCSRYWWWKPPFCSHS